MQAAIERWLRGVVVWQSVLALRGQLPRCERFLRTHGVDAVPTPILPGIIGVAKIDNLLNQWLKEQRPKELRRRDAQSEHDLRDLTRVRPPKGQAPRLPT